MTRGRVEGERDALHEAEDIQLPHGDDSRQRQGAEHGGLKREHRLDGDEHPPEVDPVRDGPANQSECRDGQRLHEGEHADGERRAGQVEDEPVGGDLLHPRPDERDAVACVVEPIVPVQP